MPHTRRTLTLTKSWDITLDGGGQIDVTWGDLATAQNVANECRLFTDDAYFIQDQGIPHFVVDLGERVTDLSVLRSYIRRVAMDTYDVAEVLSVNLDSFDTETRILTGSVTFKTTESVQDVTVSAYF